MKFNVVVDVTPEELRKVFGLPDLEPLHQEMLNRFREQMEAGVEGYDALSWLKPHIPGAIGTMEAWQKMMLGMMSNSFGMRQESNETDKKE
ncbi:hypothetical protein WH50_07245 [Pokkaliibacter plantistimulans]|uniref:Uncharacterized protein n=2 Tax=Pseudomonadota TaxID=1224 RepID=A0ABX5M2J3_9GAMM|nr:MULTISPECIES: DUF6489 family protein [Pokkaliibacter]MDH2436077.1 DUF6489 family protein [Pokkaliibacter sp. MBI-7]PPC76493.1 hypothetical protein C4K68_15245 [Pokkaliibacter plantistimulans]PXF31893.1 hypothetical protein WH50_07245 [Pokkaliibacter plantistimulans]